MKPLFVESIGQAAPGLPGWSDSRATVAGKAPYVPAELAPFSPELLPPNERRRATATVRLAFRCAEDALRGSSLPAADLATVFASADGDMEVVNRINQSLAAPARTVSPTDFHNSVHNAPAGYWSIAVGARQPSTSLAAHDASFAAALLEAAALAVGDHLNVLLAMYDIKAPAPLAAKRPTPQSFGVALVLTPARTANSFAALQLANLEAAETRMADAALEALRAGNAAARCLPLLRLLARHEPGTVVLPGVGSALAITTAPPPDYNTRGQAPDYSTRGQAPDYSTRGQA